MTDLSDFLLARIAEDEAVAKEAAGVPWDTIAWPNGSQVLVAATAIRDEKWRVGHLGHVATVEHSCDVAHIARHDPARILAECDAKRRIVEAHPLTSDVVPVHTGPQPDVGCETCHTVTAASVMDPDYVEALGPCETLLALALPYADHPDYRQEWKP